MPEEKASQLVNYEEEDEVLIETEPEDSDFV